MKYMQLQFILIDRILLIVYINAAVVTSGKAVNDMLQVVY